MVKILHRSDPHGLPSGHMVMQLMQQATSVCKGVAGNRSSLFGKWITLRTKIPCFGHSKTVELTKVNSIYWLLLSSGVAQSGSMYKVLQCEPKIDKSPKSVHDKIIPIPPPHTRGRLGCGEAIPIPPPHTRGHLGCGGLTGSDAGDCVRFV